MTPITILKLTEKQLGTLITLLLVSLATACGTLQLTFQPTPTAAPRAGISPSPTPIFDRPRYENEVNVIFDERLHLLGYSVRPQEGGPGSLLTVTLIWQVLDEISADYNTYVQLLNEQEQVLVQSDAPTGGGWRQSPDWLIDEYIYDQHKLRLPGEMALTDVAIRVGLYDAGQGQRSETADLSTVTIQAIASRTPPRPTFLAPTPLPTRPRSGIPALDGTIAAILSNDTAAKMERVRLTTIGCTHELGMGGSPKCEADQQEGTPVTYLPILGPGEGQHVMPDALENTLDFEVEALYGVYRRAAQARDDPAFPAGAYGLIFTMDKVENVEETILVHVDGAGQIVRLDYVVGPLAARLEREVDEWIVPPAATPAPMGN